MVALDDRTRDAEGFDDVRINGPLAKPLNVLELVCLFVEDLDEATADDLTLLFGVSDTLESREELISCVDADDIEPQVLVVT